MVDLENLRQVCRGRWYNILTSLGLSETYLTGKHCPCPICKGGEDRWRWDDKGGTGSFFCNQCTPQAGDGFSLVMKYLNIGFPEAIKKIQSIVGGCEKMPDKKPAPDPRPRLNKVWSASTLLTGGDPVSKYLHSRGIVLLPDNVRYCAKCYNKELGSEIPALIARIQNKEGKPVSLHRIYLQDVSPKKKLMTGTESLNGCAIRLFMPGGLFKGDVLGIGEGLETCIAAAQIFFIATWSCLNSTILESFEPPENIRKIVIWADNDASFTGQKSAYVLANKLYKKDLIVSVETPLKAGTDWNDVLLEKD